VLLGEGAAITSPVEIAGAVRRLVDSSARVTPLVVVFDDLQWALGQRHGHLAVEEWLIGLA
jgi:hypothetical protein